MIVTGVVLLITGDTRHELTTDARFYGGIGGLIFVLSFLDDD